MPCEYGLVDVRDGRGAAQADKNLRVLIFLEIMIHCDMHLKVLADCANHRFVRGSELPVNSIIEHVKEDDNLISDADLMITEQLYKELLYPIELIFIIRNLSK